jgi:hypothetical protein|tara:strand:- start:125 stop:421 length:297 start_codon:yes stop_codon:yes gene_type:complete
MSRGIGSGVSKKENLIRNYKGFDYQRLWCRKHGSSVGQWVYCIDVPNIISKDDVLYAQSITVRSLFFNFSDSKEMKETVDSFIESYPKIHEQVLQEVV